MTDGDSISHVAVVILLLALAVPALATAYDYAGTPYGHSETLTVDYSAASEVSENATTEGYRDTATITVNGTTLTDGVDYQWNTSSGEVTWFNTTNTSSGDTATIEYQAYQRTAQTEASWAIIAPLMGLFGLFGFVAAVRALWSYSAEVWDLT